MSIDSRPPTHSLIIFFCCSCIFCMVRPSLISRWHLLINASNWSFKVFCWIFRSSNCLHIRVLSRSNWIFRCRTTLGRRSGVKEWEMWSTKEIEMHHSHVLPALFFSNKASVFSFNEMFSSSNVNTSKSAGSSASKRPSVLLLRLFRIWGRLLDFGTGMPLLRCGDSILAR